MTVIEFKKKEPHISGEAICLSCGHNWVSIAPTGTIWLECPECHVVRGRFVYQCERDGLHWECDCGNDLFHVTEDGFYCPNCGLWQYGFQGSDNTRAYLPEKIIKPHKTQNITGQENNKDRKRNMFDKKRVKQTT